MNFKKISWLLFGLLLGAASYWIVQRRIQLPSQAAHESTSAAIAAAADALTLSRGTGEGSQRTISQSSRAATEEQWRDFLRRISSQATWNVSRDDRGRVIVISDGNAQ